MSTARVPARDLRGEGGFSLIELLVAIVLVGVIGGVVTTAVVQSLQVSAAATVRVDALTSLQTAQERLSRTIRSADPLNSAAATALSLDVYDSPAQRRIVEYALDGTTLTQTSRTFSPPSASTPSATATTAVITDLDQGSTPVFTYLTTAGQPWTSGDVTEIRQVRVTLQALVGDADPIALTTSVFIRNTEVTP